MASEGEFNVALPYDSAAKFGEYAHPQMIVSTEWLAAHLDHPGLGVAEAAQEVLLCQTGHSPGAGEGAPPQRTVSTEWLAAHLDGPGLVVAESDEDVLLYETGHIPGAVKLDWHTELNDPLTRDYVDGAGFARLMSAKGITRDTTLVLYGDRNNR